MAQSHDRSPHRLRAAFRRRKGERGFTLVEALVSTMLLTGGMVAVAQLLVISLSMHHLGRRQSEASAMATAKIEELMKLNFNTAAAIAVTPTSPDSLSENVANYFDTTAAGYTRRWKVEAGPVADTRRVTVRVVPPRIDFNQFRTVEVVTIIRRW
jgi:type II secretory pathway pseudopilin PulG